MRVIARTIQQVSEDHYLLKLELIANRSAAAAAICEGGEYSLTPTGTYPPNNSATTAAAGVVYYGRAGTPAPELPTPGFVGNPNFPEYGTGGSPDFIGDCAASYVRVMVVGEGTLSVQTAIYSGSARGLQAQLLHTGAPTVTDQTQAGTTGDTFTFDVSTHGGTECIHWVDIVDDAAVCGGKFGFVGATWTQAT